MRSGSRRSKSLFATMMVHLHAWSEIAAVDAQPDIEIASLLAHADVRLRDHGAVEVSFSQHSENLRVALPKSCDRYISVRIEAPMAQELAHVPIAAAAFAQDTELRPLELRERGKLLTCDEIEHCAASHTAANNPEAGAVCHGCQPRWRAELTHKQPSRIELGSDLRAAEDNA